jgi:hypothetical protein
MTDSTLKHDTNTTIAVMLNDTFGMKPLISSSPKSKRKRVHLLNPHENETRQ